MKKLFNKLSNSGNLRDEPISQENVENHYRKNSSLPSDAKDSSEDFKMKKSFSLSKASSPRYKEAMENQDIDFAKKKSTSTGLKKEKIKKEDKLNVSDDKLVRKSKSLKNVSTKKSSDQIKSPNSMRSPSLKTIFASQYEQQKDGKDTMMENSDSDEEIDAFVPHQHPDVHDDEMFNASTPIRVPSAPARMAHSPSSNSSSFSPSPSPTLVSLHVRAASPTVVPTTPTAFSTPTTPTYYSSPSSPSFASSSPTAQVPSFSATPPAHALVPSPHVIVADEFETTFAQRDNKDDIGSPFKTVFGNTGHVQMEQVQYAEPEVIEDMETDDMIHHKKGGLFSFGSNKSMKLKA